MVDQSQIDSTADKELPPTIRGIEEQRLYDELEELR